MRCSQCSEEIKPVVALDIDGTLGDYHTHFFDFAESYLGRGLNRNYHGGGGFREWFELQGVTAESYRAVKLAYRQGGMKRSMPIFDGAVLLASTISWADAELWVTTTRPYLSLDNIVPDTVEWLERHGIEYDGMLFDEDKYEQLVKRVDPERVVAVIDDLPEMCEAANEAVGRNVALLMGTRYNSAHREFRHPIDEITVGIVPLINEWKERHGSALAQL